MSIDPNREYLPTEIAENGFILSEWGKKSPRAIRRLCQFGKLKAKPVIIFGNKTYKVLGRDIIEYLEKQPKNEQK